MDRDGCYDRSVDKLRLSFSLSSLLVVFAATAVVAVILSKRRTVGFGSVVTQEACFTTQARMRGLLAKDANLRGGSWDGGGKRLLRGHRILEGSQTVLLWREATEVWTHHDLHHFRMLTLEIRDPKAGTTRSIPSPGVRAFYSSGNAVFAIGAYNEAISGTIRIRSVSVSTIEATVNLEIPLSDNAYQTPDGNVMQIRRDFTFKYVPGSELSLWHRAILPWPGHTDVPPKFADD